MEYIQVLFLEALLFYIKKLLIDDTDRQRVACPI